MKCFFTDKSITIDPSGRILPCCRYRFDSLLNNQNIRTTDSLVGIHETETYNKLRNQLENNIWPSGCKRCESDEQYGIESRRKSFASYKNRFIDIAVGNYCNLKCIMCSATFSSQWTNDQQKLIDNGFANHYKDLVVNNIISKEDIDKIIEWIQEESSDVDIEIKGGEPLSLPISEYLFKKLSSLENNITVILVTNGTFFPKWLPDIADKIKLKISLSIDGIHDVYDYIRGTDKYDFNLFYKNYNQFRQLPLDYLNLNFVAQNTNIHQLHKCIHFFNEQHVNTIFLRTPPWLQLWVMPQSSKEQILKNLQSISQDYPNYGKIESVIRNLDQNNDEKLYNKFVKFVALMDKQRNKCLPKLMPHLFTKESLRVYYASV